MSSKMEELERRFKSLNYIKQYIIINYVDDYLGECPVEKRTVEYLSQVLNNTTEEDIYNALRDVAIFPTVKIRKPDWNTRTEHLILLKPADEIPEFQELIDNFWLF